MKHYVYIYLDPRKPGKYSYANLNFSLLYEPFYIGKGKDLRAFVHISETRIYNKIKNYKINKIIKESYKMQDYILKIYTNLSDLDACNLEIDLIKNIGRICTSEGPLTNLTKGGEGQADYKQTEEHKHKIRLSKLGKKRPPFSETWKKNISKANSGTNHRQIGTFLHSDKTKQKMSESRKGEMNKNAKTYLIISPLNITYNIKGLLKNFCKEHNLSYKRMRSNINLGKIIAKNNYSLKNQQSINCENWEIKEL